MQRIFTKSVGRKYSAGDVRDFPKPVWKSIADSFGQPLDEFSKPISDFGELLVKASVAADQLSSQNSSGRARRRLKE